MKQRDIFKFGILIVLVAVIVVIGWQFNVEAYFNRETLEATVASFGIWAPVAYMVIYALATMFFVPGSPLTLAGGALFGAWLGTLWTVIGATIGATIAFLVSFYLGRSFVARLLGEKARRLEEYNKKMEKHGFSVILLLRLIPLFPFNALNYGLGLTQARMRDYVAATFFGIIPGAFVYSYLGASLAMFSPWRIGLAIVFILILIAASRIAAIFMRTREDNEYDVIIIGAGAGGLNVAGFMNKAGFKVLLIDKDEESIGGDCLNYGCVPSKALIHTARSVASARDAERYGLTVRGEVDVDVIISYIKEKQNIIREHENADYFRSQGMDVELGEAHFTAPDRVAVNDIEYSAQKIVLATGSRPRELAIPGIENAEVHTNETIFDIGSIPKRFVFIGGGPIGMELAQAFQRLGSQVTVVERSEEVLGKEDPEIAHVVRNRLEEEGVQFLFGLDAQEIIGRSVLVAESPDGERQEIQFDALFVGIGRIVNTEGLGLDNAGIQQDARGRLVVDSYLRTTNKRVYAVGDVAGNFMFTHAAELHASTVISNFFRPWLFRKKLNTDTMSWVTYTSPQVATFGLTPAQLNKRGLTYRVLENTFKDDDRAIVDEYRFGKLKLYIDKRERIRGGSMVAYNAGELTQELMLAMKEGIRISKVFSKVYPYPTATRINRSTIASYMSSKLTPFIKKVLRALYN